MDNPQGADRHHWTAVALCGWLKENEELAIGYRTLVRYLHEQDYARRIPRPVPEPPDRDKWIKRREAFVPELAGLLEEEGVELSISNRFTYRHTARISIPSKESGNTSRVSGWRGT